MSALTIRAARREELDAIWALVRRVVAHMNALGNPQWGEDYPTRDHYAADIDRGELLVAVTPAGDLAGVACVNSEQSPEYAPLPWCTACPALVIHRMAVEPDCQRQGVGRAFFTHVEAEAIRRGIPALRIDTYSKNHRMQQLILSRGYQPVGEISLHGRPLGYPCFEKSLV